MAKIDKRKNIGRNPKPSMQVRKSPFKFYWTKLNNYLLAAGLGFLVIGYYLLSQGKWDSPIALNVSPIFLILAYLVVIPLSIIYYKKDSKNTEKESTGTDPKPL